MGFEIFLNTLKKYEGHEKVIEIPQHIETIGDYAFYGLDELETVIIPEGVKEIGSYAFYSCSHLKNIILPESVVSIGNGAFSLLTSLEDITLPPHIKSIDKSTFFKCTNLKSIHIPESITSIGHSAFSHCEALTHIHLPQDLRSIGDSAFEECLALKSIQLPPNLKTLGKKDFFHCPNLQMITMNPALQEVGDGAFQTHSYLQFEGTDDFFITSAMFDWNWNLNWNYSFKIKNGDNYALHHSYLPLVDLKKWKPVAKVVLLVNFLETFDRHHASNSNYQEFFEKLKDEVLHFLFSQQRYDGLNQGILHEWITSNDILPYLEQVTDKEERAYLLSLNENKASSSYDALEDELDALFD